MGAVAVVGPQFCAPYAVPLTVTKKALSLTDGDFVVMDGNGAVLLKVKGVFFAFRERRLLLDAAGNPLLSMQAKVHYTDIFSLFFYRYILPYHHYIVQLLKKNYYYYVRSKIKVYLFFFFDSLLFS